MIWITQLTVCYLLRFYYFLCLLRTDAAVNNNNSPSQSSSINDISSMSTEQTLASDTDSSLDASTGPLDGCRWSASWLQTWALSESNDLIWVAFNLMKPHYDIYIYMCCMYHKHNAYGLLYDCLALTLVKFEKEIYNGICICANCSPQPLIQVSRMWKIWRMCPWNAPNILSSVLTHFSSLKILTTFQKFLT